jgi:hypothetical protein
MLLMKLKSAAESSLVEPFCVGVVYHHECVLLACIGYMYVNQFC